MKAPAIWDHTNRTTGVTVPKVHLRVEFALSLEGLIDGLCSKYWRYRQERDLIPESLPLAEVLETVRDEFARHGDNNTWTWSDTLTVTEGETARAWAEQIILAHIPGLAKKEN